MNRKNRRALHRGLVMRASDVAMHRPTGPAPSRLLPSLAGRPAAGPVDAQALRLELNRLAELGRRMFST